MLQIYHLMRFFKCGKRTAFRRLHELRDAFGVHNITIVDFCKYYNITIEDFNKLMHVV